MNKMEKIHRIITSVVKIFNSKITTPNVMICWTITHMIKKTIMTSCGIGFSDDFLLLSLAPSINSAHLDYLRESLEKALTDTIRDG